MLQTIKKIFTWKVGVPLIILDISIAVYVTLMFGRCWI